ncbi:MAG: glycosyltransferase family 4 protein [Syntrophotaleaceae bacterium]
MKIAVLGLRGIPEVMGGVERHCQELYPRLVIKGHQVTLFARKGYVQSEPYEYRGVRVFPLWAPRKKSLEAIFHTAYGLLIISLRRKEFDLVHIHAIGPSLMVFLAKILGLKVVMTHHGPDYDRKKWGRIAKFALRMGEQVGCRFSNAVITVSQNIRQSINRMYHREGVYIPNGVPLPEILNPGEYLEKYHLLSGKYLLTVGRFVPEKGFHDLLNAFKKIDTDWKLVIAGDADHEDEYSQELKIMALRDKRVVLTGFIKGSELGEIYSNAGLFVLPSYHEGLPIALLEAMSYDLPILTSDIPANCELSLEEERFPVGNVAALREKICHFLDGSFEKRGSRDFVANHNNWDVIAEKTEIVYCDIQSAA